MHHIFWLLPGVLAGRPGPTKEFWDLAELREAGIGAVLSVNDGELCRPSDFMAAGLLYCCVPLSPNAPPAEGDVEHCRAALPVATKWVRELESHGIATLVHCHSGKDRTGLFLAHYLVESRGLTPREAIAEVRRVRTIAFSAPGWDEFALEVLSERPG
ncbi:MAG: dual specificity protein phosphatase family protein [Polyangiaceae bacterium]